jgi:hypothetical protein
LDFGGKEIIYLKDELEFFINNNNRTVFKNRNITVKIIEKIGVIRRAND